MLSIRGLDKRFGATHAVRDVSFDAQRGQVLGLVGENGAGKSTVIRMIGGVIAPDGGSIHLDGNRLALRSPSDALVHGIDSVFQELALIGNLTVAENLFLLKAPTRPWLSIDRRRAAVQAVEILERHQLDIAPIVRVGSLPLGQRQMLEIVRSVERDPTVLVLDEATSSLGQSEVGWLARLVRRLRDAGRIVLFISHRWDEITTFCDQVAVMRNGRLVEVADCAAMSQDRAVKLMTGHDRSGGFPPKAAPRSGVLLDARDLKGRMLSRVSFTLAPGEILGLGGLVGQGQTELLRALFAAPAPRSGSIALKGQKVRLREPRAAIAAGIAYVPLERKSEGVFLDKSVAFNMTYSLLALGRLSSWFGVIRYGRERSLVAVAIERLKIRAPDGRTPIRALSGGNQQKVLLEKWLETRPALLLLDDVTRGVDISTKHQIYDLIRALAREGVGVIFYSSDTNELVGLADRVLVMADGEVRRSLAGDELTAAAVVDAAFGPRMES
jgi:ribose transport system ATP-binding protein